MRSSLLAEAYLTFPPREEITLGGMQWSREGDAIEDADGRTVCLVEQLHEVLHGAFASGSVPHFSHLMYLLRAIRFGGSTPAFERIKRVYAECSTAAALGRNTGALIGHLCSGLALELNPPTMDEVLETLASRRRHGLRQRADLKQYVAMPLSEAGAKLAAQVAAMSDDQLRHWFRFGASSLPPDDRVAEELESLPQRVLKLIAAARTSQRLVGAASLIPALDAGLTIPPRKKSPDAVPQGGYADVTTRGDPDRLLPSQFALDPDEFVRRFAERELLYFQREEPHETQKPERVLVFDQGVRTWGRVRLALAGAVLSLLKYDARRIGDARLFVTSQPERIDLRSAKIEVLQEVLEASDFTTQPGIAFRQAVEEAALGDAPRDLIVLTHPRNAAALLEAAELRRPGDRIFTLAVDEEGIAKLAELRDEGFVALRSFRLDLQAAAEEQVQGDLPAKPKPFAAWQPWTGDVEPIGFPFRPGIVADVDVLGFTAKGDWLVTASKNGVLHAIACDGTGVEVLPRAMHTGKALHGIRSILPVSGGVVLVGTPFVSMTSNATFDTGSGMALSMVLAHYDLRKRRVKVHLIPTVGESTECLVQCESHAVVVFQSQPSHTPKYLVDLHSGTISNFHSETSEEQNVAAARTGNRKGEPPYEVSIHDSSESLPRMNGPFLCFDRYLVTVRGTESSWVTFLPLSNGKPVLEEAKIVGAQLAGQTLALTLSRDHRRSDKLILFSAPDGRILMEFERPAHAPFTLSPDGDLLGRRRGRREVAVQVTAESRDPNAVAYPAKLHDQLEIHLIEKPFQLGITIGGQNHSFEIVEGRLLHKPIAVATHHRSPKRMILNIPSYDEQRFPVKSAVSDRNFLAIADRHGLVHLFGKGSTIDDGPAIIASFCIRRDLAAAWIPGGVFWGSAALIGGPPHRNGAELIGRAILNAGGAE